MGFVPIQLPDYVQGLLKGNRRETAAEVTARLQSACDKGEYRPAERQKRRW